MIAYEIELQAEVEVAAEIGQALLAAAAAAAAQQGIPAGTAFTLLLTDDTTLRQLNRDFRGYDQTTDVLSFPAGEPSFPGEAAYLGDIAISVPQASRQAEAGGHALMAELQLLVVHGVLHLCGHDHGEPEEKEAMWSAQAEILRGLGAAIIAPVLADESPH